MLGGSAIAIAIVPATCRCFHWPLVITYQCLFLIFMLAHIPIFTLVLVHKFINVFFRWEGQHKLGSLQARISTSTRVDDIQKLDLNHIVAKHQIQIVQLDQNINISTEWEFRNRDHI